MILQKREPERIRLCTIPNRTECAATCQEVSNSNPAGVRESNRIASVLGGSLRAILTAVMLTAFFISYGFPIQFEKSIPESDSSISSFDFTLEFDISEALVLAASDKPDAEVGLGYAGGQEMCATLYKGDDETGIVLAKTMTANFHGKSEGFVVNGNKISVNFDSSIPIIANQEYTVKITNIFYLYVKGKTTRAASTKSDYTTSPIILKFKGAGSEKPQLICSNSSIKHGDILSNIKTIDFNLSSPFSINPDSEVVIKEGEGVIARTGNLTISSDDDRVLNADFGEIALYNGHTYSIILPENALTIIDDVTIGNFEYKVDVIGSCIYPVPLLSSKVDLNSKGIPTSVTFIYDIPEGANLNSKNITGSRYGFLAEDGSEETTNFDTNFTFVANNRGLKWDLSSFRFNPSTKYSFTKPGNTVIVFDNNGNILKECVGEDAEISFTTPSIEVAGYAPLEFKDATIQMVGNSERTNYSENMECESIDKISLQLKDLFYFVDNTKYNLHTNPNLPDKNICTLYEISSDGDKLLKTYSFSVSGSMEDGYMTANCSLNSLLYEGKKYKFVIPQGYFTAYPDIYAGSTEINQSEANYIRNNEMVYLFSGATPAKVELLSCNVEDKAEVSSLYNIVWTFKGTYQLSDDVTTIKKDGVSVVDDYTIKIQPVEYPVIVSNRNGKTFVMIDLVSKETGLPFGVRKGQTLTFTMPKGLLVNTLNNDIVNDQIVLNVIGKDAAAATQTVNVSLTINDLHSASHKAVKGEKYSFTVKPNKDWKVESVMHGDKVLSEKNGVYETEPLNEDADIRANLKYDGLWADYSEITEVWTVKDSKIRIYSDSQHIVVEGVTPDNVINVYCISGLHINSTKVTDGNDRVRIAVASEQTYIVTVDGVAARILVK